MNKLILSRLSHAIRVRRHETQCWVLYYDWRENTKSLYKDYTKELCFGEADSYRSCDRGACPYTPYDAIAAMEMFYTVILGRTHETISVRK